ncbi:MAG: hypothetical protein F2667_05050 [Actinobacteria bacterium]|uniref:Unannotated protein n=1 Tax=freshwater metagenome TaxID=449393 RepID=A0A6J6PWQ9_9ZZZZ|nr:hypothetical protein [Actinomycetota bacterium]
MRTITVTQPALINSSLILSEAAGTEGKVAFAGLLKRSAHLDLGNQRIDFTTLGLLGRAVRARAADGTTIGEFHQTGILGRGYAAIDGRRYRLRISGVLSRRFSWVDAHGTEAVRLTLGGVLRTSGVVHVADSAVPDDVAVLIGLGLIARRASESGSAAAAT